jgi:hypothetical protein
MIKHLNLLVRINELRIKPGSELTPTTKTRYFEPLDQFYRQVVRLMGLQHLDLRMDMMSPSNERQEDIPTYAEVSIPGLINVGMGRPGYLELLSGLSKLKQPCGSVLADTYETRLRVGAVEASSMRDHWPKLCEWADFIYTNSALMEPFKIVARGAEEKTDRTESCRRVRNGRQYDREGVGLSS